jgi:translation initiation factor IF-2
MLVLQSQLLELKAESNVAGKGYVLESKIEKGRGPIATIIAKHGHIRIGDYFVCGDTAGRVTSIVNSSGASLESVGPSIPVQIAGFVSLAQVGDYFKVVEKEAWREAKSQSMPIATSAALAHRHMAVENAINLIIKTDTHSSLEALLDSIDKIIRKAPVGISIIFTGVGYISESDVELAYTTNSHILGLHTRAESKAVILAQQRNVSIHLFNIIYKLLEFLEQFAESKKAKEMMTQKSGEAVVLRVFDIKGVGIVAGCRVTEGKFLREGSVTVWRGRQKIGDGKIISLQREKRSVKEVNKGFECGITIEGVSDFAPDDRIECFIQVPIVS